MPRPRVLQIGLDPDVIDFSPWPGQTVDALRDRIAAALADLEAAGLDATQCLVPADPDGAAVAVGRAMTEARYDAVEIGSGLRSSHEHTVVFERVVNDVVALQPGVRLCFNDSPETTLEAVRRALRR